MNSCFDHKWLSVVSKTTMWYLKPQSQLITIRALAKRRGVAFLLLHHDRDFTIIIVDCILQLSLLQVALNCTDP